MTRLTLLAAFLTLSAVVGTGCQSKTTPAADPAAAENKVLVENAKLQARNPKVAYAGAARFE